MIQGLALVNGWQEYLLVSMLKKYILKIKLA
jgi:hypothetical protein